VQVNPQPDLEAIKPYYTNDYFQKRTDRGYDNYFSEELKNQLFLVYEMNLNDAGFFAVEKEIFKSVNIKTEIPSFLDVGCAAGYFVEYMKNRGWDASGIEISKDAADFGIKKLKLNIIVDDFFSSKNLKGKSFDFITLWASIEHMHSPMKVMRRLNELLKPGGRLIISTCRYGFLARYRGLNWRYMNVPEHLYFYSMKNMKRLAKETGFQSLKSFSYGSGLTAKKNAGLVYRIAKIIMDPLVKILNQGDMMVFHMKKIK
jgi:2-polyprenyl-3-methyl-5-hydroxy-6-metoxy-1,4-benzoquinol methylase